MSALRDWTLHGVLFLVALAFVLRWAMAHQTTDELLRLAAEGAPEERLRAWHVLANRGEPAQYAFDPAFVHALLEEPPGPVRDFAFSIDVCKHTGSDTQDAWIRKELGRGVDAELFRTIFLHTHKAGGLTVGGEPLYLRGDELAWFLNAVHGEELPAAEVLEHVRTTSRFGK